MYEHEENWVQLNEMVNQQQHKNQNKKETGLLLVFKCHLSILKIYTNQNKKEGFD